MYKIKNLYVFIVLLTIFKFNIQSDYNPNAHIANLQKQLEEAQILFDSLSPSEKALRWNDLGSRIDILKEQIRSITESQNGPK